MGFYKRLFCFLIRPKRASKCGRFAKSFGLSEKIDGANRANGTDGVGLKNGRRENSCKAFSQSQ